MPAKYQKMGWKGKALLGGSVALAVVLGYRSKKAQATEALENVGMEYGPVPARFQPSAYSNPGRNFGYPVPVQGAMAKNYLWQMGHDATDLYTMLEDSDTLPDWVNYYISTSSDRLQQASRYMQHKIEETSYGDALLTRKDYAVAGVIALVGTVGYFVMRGQAKV